MSIARLYNKSVSTKRLTVVGTSNKTAYQTNLTGVSCRIDQADGEGSFLGDGALYKGFKMYCETSTDIKELDRVIYGSTEYTVRGVKTLSFRERSPHLEVLLELAQ